MQVVIYKTNVDVVAVQYAVELRGLVGMDVQINGTAGGLHLPVEACKQGDVQTVRASDGQKSAVSVLGQYLGFLPQGYVPLGDGYKLAAFGGELNVFKPFFPDNQREAQLLFFSLWLTVGWLRNRISAVFVMLFVFTMVRKVSISERSISSSLNINLVNIIY